MRTRVLLPLVIVFALVSGAAWAVYRIRQGIDSLAATVHAASLTRFEVGRETRTFDLARARSLTIDNHFGEVTVRPGGPDLRVEATTHARGEDLEDARRRARGLRIVGRPDGRTGFRLTAGQSRSDPTAGVDLAVYLPPTLALCVTVRAGRVAVHRIRGPVEVRADAGEVLLEDLSGPIAAHTRAGQLDLRRLTSSRVQASVDVGEVNVDFARPFSGRLDASARAGQINIGLKPGSRCQVSTDASIGQVSDDLSPRLLYRSGPGRIRATVGIGEIRLSEAP